MAIISNRPSALGQGIGALSQILSQYTQEQQQRSDLNQERQRQSDVQQNKQRDTMEHGTILESVVRNFDEETSVNDKIKGFSNAIAQGVPFDDVMKMVNQYSTMQKSQPAKMGSMSEKQQAKKEKGAGLKKVIGKMREQMDYTGSQLVPGKGFDPTQFAFGKKITPALNRAALRERSGFDTSAMVMESVLKELSTSGQMSAQVFKKLMEKVPNSGLSDAENTGRLNAFEDLVDNLFLNDSSDTESIDVTETETEESPSFKKVPRGTPLNDRVVMEKILEFKGNDIEEAKKYAKLLGYEVP